MRSAVDTSLISAIWADQPRAPEAEDLLQKCSEEGGLVICGIVYAELLAHPHVEPTSVESLLIGAGIAIDFETDRALWHEAGLRYRAYTVRRRRANNSGHKRLLADFVVGVHASLHADQLLTLNASDFRSDFPKLRMLPAARTQ